MFDSTRFFQKKSRRFYAVLVCRVSKTDTDIKMTDTDIDFSNYPGYLDPGKSSFSFCFWPNFDQMSSMSTNFSVKLVLSRYVDTVKPLIVPAGTILF